MDPFIALMRRYCIDYVARHDFTQLEHIMAEDYVLRMGDHEIAGRDGPYANATRIQMDQLPNLMLTPHQLITNGERLAMRFSEHGASPAKSGAQASWGGISMYHWDRKRLIDCAVEQDYYARREQYARGTPDPVDSPAVAPWDVVAEPSSAEVEEAVCKWLDEGAPPLAGVYFDDAWLPGRSHHAVLDVNSTDVLDLFSAGDKVAFRVRQNGRLCAPFGGAEAGTEAQLFMTGIVTVSGSAIVRGRGIRDRMGLERRLRGQVVKPV